MAPVLLVAALVLVPYTALFVPFQPGLALQLALLVTVIVVAAWDREKEEAGELGRKGEGERGRDGERYDAAAPSHVPMAVVMGLGLYAAAALWGAGIGVLSGNPTRYVASQAISMLLLPAGSWAFFRTRGLDAKSVGRGLAIAALIACLLHVVIVAGPFLRHTLAGGRLRFALRNDADAMGAVVLLFVVLAARWAAKKTLSNGAAAGAAAILLIGSQTRGAWISGAIGIIIVMALFPGRRWRRLVIGMACGLLAAFLGWAMVSWAASQARTLYTFDARSQRSWRTVSRPARSARQGGFLTLVPTLHRGSGVTLVRDLPAAAPAMEVNVRADVPRGQAGFVWLKVLDATGRKLDKQRLTLEGTGRWARYSRIFVLPHEASYATLGIWAGRGIHPVQLSTIHVATYSLMPAAWLCQISRRLTGPLRSLTGGPQDPNVAYRMRELRAIWTTWRRASPIRLFIGQGLGATFAFVNSGWDSHGRRTKLHRASYIHDFYVMLAFKLGVAGIAALAGLIMVVLWTFRQAIKARGLDRWFLQAAAAAWAVYLLWSISSPEIYDFRMAPIWGALVAACVRTGNMC